MINKLLVKNLFTRKSLILLSNRTSLKFNRSILAHPYSSLPFNSPLSDQSSTDQLVSSHDDRRNTKNDKNNSKQQSVSTIKSSVVTLKTIKELFDNQIPITMLTAYDFATARLVGMSNNLKITEDEINDINNNNKFPIGIDICLCGDSLANVCLGYQSTNELGIEEFTYHLKSIRRGLDSLTLEPHYRIPLLLADLPFGSFESSVEEGIKTATKLIQTSRVDGFKIEGGNELSPLIKKLTSFGIPIMGHIGLTPQRASSLGGFKVQGHDDPIKAIQIIQDALDLEKSGCFALVIEAVPIEIIKKIKEKIKIPLMGIGAGPETDGQVLVLSDLIGILNSKNSHLNLSKKPKFTPKDKFLLNLNSRKINFNSVHPVFELSNHIILNYILNVRTRKFPELGTHTYSMKTDVLNHLNKINWSL